MSKQYWTSLEDLEVTADAATVESDVRSILEGLPILDRRSFLKLIGLSLATGVLSSCSRPVEKIIPYLNQPPEITPGVASWYATTCHGCSAACGALAKVMDGRPIKLEGNPDHRLSKGGLCALGQGAVLSLYDASRQKGPSAAGSNVTWDRVDQEVRQALTNARTTKGKVVVLTSTVTGPATRAVIRDFLSTFPNAGHIIYDPVSYDAIREAHGQAYGQPIIPGYRFDKAEVIVSFGADFLGTWLSPVEFAKRYASGRSLTGSRPRMSRHFQFESRLSLAGSNADYRHQIAPSQQAIYIAALTAMVAKAVAGANPATRTLAQIGLLPLSPEGERRLGKTAEALLKARGRSLIVSDSNDVSVQLAVIALNELLGNVGQTIDLTRPSLQKMGRDADMARLIEEMQRGEVAAIFIHNSNPAYTHPQADTFLEGLRKVPCSVSFATAPDETSAAAKWHCPASHPMESWGDAEPQAGRYSLFQPTLRPLYDTRSFEDSLLTWAGRGLTFHDYLKRHWQAHIFPSQSRHKDFTAFWEEVLQRGFIEVPLLSQNVTSLRWDQAVAAVKQCAGRPHLDSLEVEVFEPVALRDGASANNPWLQELPDPITKITWSNYAAIAPALAREKGIEEGQWIEIEAGGCKVSLPAHIQPGQHPRTISIPLGYGRTQAGPVGNGVGENAYPLASLKGGRRIPSARITAINPLNKKVVFARTQIHSSLEGRPIVEEALYAHLGRESPARQHHKLEAEANLWSEHEYPEYRWGLVVDLTRCIGCSSCVTACDLENNVPVVGEDEVRRSREMHWLRIDRYYKGDPEDPEVVYEPMMCQQCANASCETVCPALATVHDDQGLNVQVYNRCVGTRYCANNCAYKTRRFNFFNHISNDLTRNLALNPNVTVRSRGVMEKCTFCIQRIQEARIRARREGRKVGDGEVKAACEQSCPADAIVFGNLADPRSRVSRLAASARSFRVLEEINRQPSVYYLNKVRNRDEEEVG